MNLILLGMPGSGKGTQANALVETLGLTHVASGDLFRYHLDRHTELGRLADGYMARGALVPDDVTIAMIRDRLKQPDAARGVLLDGFPRTIEQAHALDAMMAELDRTITGAIYLEVPDEALVDRLSGRWICRSCQVPFHTRFNPFTSCPTRQCEGQHLYQREDDRPDTVRARLATFHAQTAPVIEHYRLAGRLVTVPGEGSVAEVTARLIEAAQTLQRARDSEPVAP